MSQSFEQWIAGHRGIPGLLGLGIHAPGKSNLVQSFTTNFVSDALEKAWRAVTETISVLQLNRFPTARFRFVFGSAVVHCERRRDGACLGIFSQKNATLSELERLITEFHSI
jgi:hypothetical protein